MSENKTLYLKIERNTIVTDRNVRLQDIAKMECTDNAILRQLKQKKIYTFQPEEKKHRKNTLVIISVLKIMEQIHEDYPNLEISNEGESDFIVEYVGKKEDAIWLERLKCRWLLD